MAQPQEPLVLWQKVLGPVVGAKEVDLLRVGFPDQAVVMPSDGNLVDQAWQVGIVRVGC